MNQVRPSVRAFQLSVRLAAALALVLFAAALAACGKTPQAEAPRQEPAPAAAFPVTITDDTSRSVTVEAEPKRIVSLAPANTEILFELGVGDRIVGVTSYDDYPAEVKSITQVGDFAGPNMEAVASANPDVVFVTTGVQADVIAKLEELGAVVIAIDPQTLDGLYEDVSEMAAVTGTEDKGAVIVSDMKAAVEDIKERVAGSEPVTAFMEIGQNPLFTVGSGTLMDELLVIAGGRNVVSTAGYVPYSVERLVKANPQVYFATKGVASDPSAIEKRAGYSALNAVKDGRIVILEDNLVSRPGPRIVQGLEQIARGLHPASFEQ